MANTSGTAERTTQYRQHMDQAANEVFSTMLGIGCVPAQSEPPAAQDTLSAIIGLAGALSGSLVLHCSGRAALRVTELMTGMAPEAVDSMVRDALGEVCNMVAGAWKGFDALLSSGCLLSTPTVIEGSSYELFSQKASLRIDRRYQFEDHLITLTLFCQ